MRLDKFLCDCGMGSRTDVKKLVKKGVVSVNGATATSPQMQLDETCDTVTVNGESLTYRKFIYLMLNKPKDYICATWDKKLSTVIDLVPDKYLHFEPFPVGRLDIDTEGLVLLTNDGDLCHRLLSPKHHVKKTYIAEIKNPIKDEDITAFKEGVTIEGGYKTLPASLTVIDEKWAKVVIEEGKFHQVKLMFKAIANEVLYLKRVQMKNLKLDEELELGEIRELTEDEINDLTT